MTTTSYERNFTIQAAHFNNSQAYDDFYAVIDIQRETRGPSEVDLILKVLNSIHGHNFEIKIIAIGYLPEVEEGEEGEEEEAPTVWNQDYLIDDVELEKIVMEWDNKNLSTHPDFSNTRTRATTERMSLILLQKLKKIFQDQDIEWSVLVKETKDVKATSQQKWSV